MSTRAQQIAGSYEKLDLGTPVAVRDADGEIHQATIAAVPRLLRDSSRRVDFTTIGVFPKRWVTFIDSPWLDPAAWPADDVLTGAPSKRYTRNERRRE